MATLKTAMRSIVSGMAIALIPMTFLYLMEGRRSDQLRVELRRLRCEAVDNGTAELKYQSTGEVVFQWKRLDD